MIKREDEERVRSAFDAWLGSVGVQTRDWYAVPTTEEPPDFHLQLSDGKYGVEVTTLMDRLDLGTGPKSSQTIATSIYRCVKNVQSEAMSRKVLKGAYTVSAKPTPDFSKHEQAISEALLAYIADTRDIEKAPKQIIYQQHRCIWSVKKFGLHKLYVGTVLGWHARWEGEVSRELSEWLEALVSIKARKLCYVPRPRILLVRDAYNLADDGKWQEVLNRSAAARSFHTIARIHFHDGCSILRSENLDWCSAT